MNSKTDKKGSVEGTGVFSYQCDACDELIVGQTGSSFEIRIKEHTAQTENRNSGRSNIALHCLSNNHTIKWENFKILHREKKGPRLNNLVAF